MARYRTTIASRRSAEEAFTYLADFSHCEEWDPGVVRARRLDGGPVASGSRFEVVARFGGRELPLEYVITEFRPGSLVEFTAHSTTFSSVDRVTFVPTGDGCDVTYDADLSPRGMMRLVDPLLQLAFRRIGDRARDGLAEALGG